MIFEKKSSVFFKILYTLSYLVISIIKNTHTPYSFYGIFSLDLRDVMEYNSIVKLHKEEHRYENIFGV